MDGQPCISYGTITEEMPCHLSGLHDAAVSRPYGNNASALGSMGLKEAAREKEREEGGASLLLHTLGQSLRPPSHRDLPSDYPQNIDTNKLHACGIGMVHMVVPFVFTYTGCPTKNVPDFGRVFLMLNYIDITQNTYVRS